VNKKLNKERRS